MMFTVVGSVFFTPWPSHVPTHVAAPTRPTANDLPPYQDEKVSLYVCVHRARGDWNWRRVR